MSIDGPQLDIVHFVDLDDGRRVTTEEFGELSMYLMGPLTLEELRAEVLEFIFEEEMREAAA